MRVLAVTSGKGGVGKSNISANLAICLSGQGRRTTVLDADLGLANLDVILGVRPQRTLHDVIVGEQEISEIVEKGPGGVQYIAGGSGIEALLDLTGPQLEAFLVRLSLLEATSDMLILDTGAGLDENVLMFCEVADTVLLVITPDPASIADAYAIAKTLFARNSSKKISVIMNMVSDEQQAMQVFSRVNAICKQFLSQSLTYLGHVRYDREAQVQIRRRIPFVVGMPSCDAAKDVLTLTRTLLGAPKPQEKVSLIDKFRAVFSRSDERKSA